MIPVRGNSTRVPKKNLRLLGGIPLVAHAIKAAKEAHLFDEIWINSEDTAFMKIADEYGVNFYERPVELASDTATNDEFLYDFLKNEDCGIVIQLLATSPFIKPETIRGFYSAMIEAKHDTMISVKNVQIECLFNGKALNFNKHEHTQPSQSLIPVQAYACGIVGYKRDKFIRNYEQGWGAYHGGTGFNGYYRLSGFETCDIDTEEDFALAEAIISMKKKDPEYYQGKKNIETKVEHILQKDGVKNVDDEALNIAKANLYSIIYDMPAFQSWSKRVVMCDNLSITLIAQNFGECNRRHSHPDIGECWEILKGKYEFEIGDEKITASQNDLIFVPKNTIHKITAIGTDGLSVRMAISKDGAEHVYE